MLITSDHIIHDEWMSEILDLPSYFVRPSLVQSESWIGKTGPEWEWYETLLKTDSFAFVKVPTASTSELLKFQEARFAIVDTNVSLTCRDVSDMGAKMIVDPQVSFRFANAEDREETAALAANSFLYTRFHLDTRISDDKADEFKYKWVENFFHGKRGDQMVLAIIEDEIVGFLQIFQREKGYLIDLIAVGEKARRKGVAGGMILHASQELKGVEFIDVGTQIANVPSINLYEKLGFVFSEAKYVLHFLNKMN